MDKIRIFLITLPILFISALPGYSGGSFDIVDSDTSNQVLIGFFDLRDRETYIQITNVDSDNSNIHIQIFDVSNNCNENDFFDSYTPNDTHVYNLRDIKTNDGNDSGVILPDGAYGIFVAYGSSEEEIITPPPPEPPFPIEVDEQKMIGNQRILDNNGSEYRTNLNGIDDDENVGPLEEFATFNFNTRGGVTLSDIVIINFDENDDDQEVIIADILNIWSTYDVNIYDLNENAFSCRKIISSCVNQDSILYEALLEEAANQQLGACNGDCGASVADIEYGINNAIPHSKGGELLCPGNNISEGFVRLEQIGQGVTIGIGGANDEQVVFVGLNNSNGRGSMDVFFGQNSEIPNPPTPP